MCVLRLAGPLLRACLNLGVEDLYTVSGEEVNSRQCHLVFLNGLMVGVHRRPHAFAEAFRVLRRRGLVGRYVSVHVQENLRAVNISARPSRPRFMI